MLWSALLQVVWVRVSVCVRVLTYLSDSTSMRCRAVRHPNVWLSDTSNISSTCRLGISLRL